MTAVTTKERSQTAGHSISAARGPLTTDELQRLDAYWRALKRDDCGNL